jgi:hypothetical protein
MACVRQGGRWGFLDATGQPRTAYIYEEAWPFFGGKAQVRLDGRWFYIDKSGQCVQDCQGE